MQQHCSCKNVSNVPTCCVDGWKLAFCHSRFLTPAESKYAPIEGEALAVAWALEKSRLFLLGSPTFTVIVDHQPLLKILGDKSLSEISNPRLLHFKEKILPYSFNIQYIKGINNHANVFSRYPVEQPTNADIEYSKCINAITANITSSTLNDNLLITMDTIKDVANNDIQYKKLIEKIRNGTFEETQLLEDSDVRPYFNIRDRLSIVDNIIMYGFEEQPLRIVIPKALRFKIIENLHSANQGTTSMLSRARQCVYWPGIDDDINKHVLSCDLCRNISPSQQKEPLIMTSPPDYPFQKVVADIFEESGYKYLAYADRLTGFVELAYFPTNTSSSIIIKTIREFFQRWGVAEEVSADGGPNISSREIKEWLESWGVKFRLSSAYYPKSNGRAEAAVKSLKRLLKGNTKRGTIDNDKIAKALLQHRNTPLHDIEKSPAELALGRSLRDSVPMPSKRYNVDPKWAHDLRKREIGMCRKNDIIEQKHNEHSKNLAELKIGDEVYCQNMRNKSWDRSGIIIEVLPNRQCSIKLHGSGRISLRNRCHLKKLITIKPYVPIMNKTTDHYKHITKENISESEKSSDTSVTSKNSVENNISNNTHTLKWCIFNSKIITRPSICNFTLACM